MKKPVDFEEVASNNKNKFIKVLPYISSDRRLRARPRSEEESIGITIATAEMVRMAYKTGRLIKKSPKGFVLK